MSVSDKIQLTIAIITSIGIFCSTGIAIFTLIQNHNMIKDNSRAYIIFYIDFHPQTDMYYLVIKNFGNSIGKLINIEITPKLDWNKCKFKQDLKPLTDSTNVLLAPNQKISSWFDFEDYPDKIFDVKLTYYTLKKEYTENYKIDLSYVSNHDWLFNRSFDDKSKDYKKVLYTINNSILEMSDINR